MDEQNFEQKPCVKGSINFVTNDGQIYTIAGTEETYQIWANTVFTQPYVVIPQPNESYAFRTEIFRTVIFVPVSE